MGYGRQGLVLDAQSEADLERSIKAWPDSHYLFQERVLPREVKGRPVYFRAFHAFGEIWVTWWNCFTDHYQLVQPEEWQEFGLNRVESMVRQIAELTGMSFFSTEIVQTDEGEFVVIDYVNDQCHMLCQSAHPEKGVPDEIVAAIARRLVHGIAALVRPGTHGPAAT
jgi:hypothetical protein